MELRENKKASVQGSVQGGDPGAQGNGIELNEKQKTVLEFCSVPQSASDILDHINLSQIFSFVSSFIALSTLSEFTDQ